MNKRNIFAVCSFVILLSLFVVFIVFKDKNDAFNVLAWSCLLLSFVFPSTSYVFKNRRKEEIDAKQKQILEESKFNEDGNGDIDG